MTRICLIVSHLQGDADGHDVWVLTTSAYGFYEMLGFSVVGEATVGTENPEWDRDPVTLRVVSDAYAHRTQLMLKSCTRC